MVAGIGFSKLKYIKVYSWASEKKINRSNYIENGEMKQ